MWALCVTCGHYGWPVGTMGGLWALWVTCGHYGWPVGTMGGLSYISLFKLSPHVCKHVGCNYCYSTLYPPCKFLQSGVQWCSVCCILYVPPVEGWSGEGHVTGGEVTGLPLLITFFGTFFIQEVLNCNAKCSSAPAYWNSVTRALVFWKNGRWNSSTLFTYEGVLISP